MAYYDVYTYYNKAGMVTKDRRSKNSLFFYKGKNGYANYIADPDYWENVSGLGPEDYEIMGWIDLNCFQPIPCKANVDIPELENTSYIAIFGEIDGYRKVGVIEPAWDKKYFCHNKITAYIPYAKSFSVPIRF